MDSFKGFPVNKVQGISDIYFKSNKWPFLTFTKELLCARSNAGHFTFFNLFSCHNNPFYRCWIPSFRKITSSWRVHSYKEVVWNCEPSILGSWVWWLEGVPPALPSPHFFSEETNWVSCESPLCSSNYYKNVCPTHTPSCKLSLLFHRTNFEVKGTMLVISTGTAAGYRLCVKRASIY